MSGLLSPESLQQIKRLDLRARMVIRGFLQGLHSSPLHGFSVQFSEHRRYNRGDDPKLIDWLVYAKTDKYYVKRFEAETNLTGFLAIDLSESMGLVESIGGAGASAGITGGITGAKGHASRGSMSKFEYATCLAASLTYLMTMQQDPVGLLTLGEKVHAELPARSRRGHLGDVMARLTQLKPTGGTDLGTSLTQVAAMLRHHSLVMLFSDLQDEPESIMKALTRLRHGGHDVIVFHILDEAEVKFPYEGPVQFEDAETHQTITVDATGFREDYLKQLDEFRDFFRDGCNRLRVDYVPLDTSMPFDKALTEYLMQRQSRF